LKREAINVSGLAEGTGCYLANTGSNMCTATVSRVSHVAIVASR